MEIYGDYFELLECKIYEIILDPRKFYIFVKIMERIAWIV